MAAEREFPQSARAMLSAVLQAGGAREAVLFTYSDRPSLLSSIASDGFALMPEPAVIPLLPKHFHALQSARGPIILNAGVYDAYLSSNGNVAPELFKCIAPLKIAGKLVGMVALGRRDGDAVYDIDELEALDLLCHYIALAIHNHALTQTLAQRVSENLRLLGSLHGFYDTALEAFATAIDIKRGDGSGYPDGLVMDDVPMPVRIIALADTFDAMTSPRPYREPISIGATLSEIVRITPEKFDPNAVHALLVQVRRDAVGSNRTPFFDDRMASNISPVDVDHLAASLQHKITHGRLYLT